MRNDPGMTTESPKRRWPQFRLRTLLIVVLVLSLPLSWLAVKMERARRQREAVEAIQDLNGFVDYDYQHDLGSDDYSPMWLRSILGDTLAFHYSNPVESVELGESVGDAELAILKRHLEAMPCLTHLSLVRTSVTDNGLTHVSGLYRLESLWVSRRVTEQGAGVIGDKLPDCHVAGEFSGNIRFHYSVDLLPR